MKSKSLTIGQQIDASKKELLQGDIDLLLKRRASAKKFLRSKLNRELKKSELADIAKKLRKARRELAKFLEQKN